MVRHVTYQRILHCYLLAVETHIFTMHSIRTGKLEMKKQQSCTKVKSLNKYKSIVSVSKTNSLTH